MGKKTRAQLTAEKDARDAEDWAQRGKSLEDETAPTGTERTTRQRTQAARKCTEQMQRAETISAARKSTEQVKRTETTSAARKSTERGKRAGKSIATPTDGESEEGDE